MIAARDTFVEYDPDVARDDVPHARIARALRALGLPLPAIDNRQSTTDN